MGCRRPRCLRESSDDPSRFWMMFGRLFGSGTSWQAPPFWAIWFSVPVPPLVVQLLPLPIAIECTTAPAEASAPAGPQTSAPVLQNPSHANTTMFVPLEDAFTSVSASARPAPQFVLRQGPAGVDRPVDSGVRRRLMRPCVIHRVAPLELHDTDLVSRPIGDRRSVELARRTSSRTRGSCRMPHPGSRCCPKRPSRR